MATARVVGRVSVRVMPDTSRFKKDLQKSLDRLERTLEVKIPTALNTRGLTDEAVKAKRRIERVLGNVETTVNVDTKRGEATVRRLVRDRTVPVRTEVDRPSLATARRALSRLVSSIGRTARRGLVFGTVAAGIATLGAAAASSVVPVLQLGAALAPAAGALTAIPGAVALAAVALGTLRLATKGVGDAFKAALGADAEKFKASLAGLSPAARSVALEMRRLRPALLGVQLTAQNAVFAPFRGELTKTAKVLVGPLRAGLVLVGQQLGSAGVDAARFARQAQTVAAVRTVFRDAATSISRLRTAFEPLLSGFRDLAVVGSGFLTSLTPAIGAAGAAFGKFLSDAARSGQALEWMQTALGVLQQLGRILGNVGSIFASIFRAANATGGGLLGTIEQITGRFAEFLRSTEGARTLQAIFAGLSQIGKALGPVVIALARGLGQIAPAVGRIALVVGPVLTSAINALAPALAALEPGITALIRGLGGAIEAIGPALVPVARALSSIAVGLAPVLPALGQLIAMLAEGLAAHIQRMVASGALTRLVDAIIQLAFELGGGLLNAIVAISPYLPDLVIAFSDLLLALVPLIPPLIQAAIALAPLIPIVTDVIKLLTQLANAVMPLVVFSINSQVKATQEIVKVVRFAWGYIYGYIRDRIENLKSAISRLGTLPTDFARWFAGARDAAGRRLSDLVTTVRGIPGRISGALGNLGGLLRNAGRNLIQGLINGITSKFRDLANTMHNVAQTVRDYWPFSPAKHGPLRTHPMDKAGRNLAAMLAEGMARGETLVARAASDLAGAAVVSPNLSTAVGASAGPPVLEIRSGGSGLDDLLLEIMRNAVRVRGGNVQLVFAR